VVSALLIDGTLVIRSAKSFKEPVHTSSAQGSQVGSDSLFPSTHQVKPAVY